MAISGEIKTASDFNVFSGAENGILKCVSINPKANLLKNFNHNSSPLDREQEITCLEWGQEDESELLVGLRCQTVKIFDVGDKTFSESRDVKAGYGALRGVAKYDDTLITAAESGLVRLWRAKEEDRFEVNVIDVEIESSGKLKSGGFETEEARDKHIATIKAGRQLCKMRQIPCATNMIATGGKENRLQLWDLNRPDASPIFAAKNVKPDTLQLRVPVWVTDICFPDATSASSVATVSRYGHIRLYDTRLSQRRPVQDLIWEDEALTAASATGHNEQILVGSGTGNLALYDFRTRHKGMFRKYKGCVGSVRSIYCLRDKPYFAVAGLDRFLRIFNINSQKSVQKMYLKSRLNCVLLAKSFDPSKVEVEVVPESKGSKRADDIRPDIEVVGEQDDERFWAKIPVIREKKKRGGSQKETPSSGAPIKKKK